MEIVEISVVEAAENVTINVSEGYGNITNSDNTFSASVIVGRTLSLPDITHTDSDGLPVTLPAQTPMVCSLPVCSGVDVVNSDDTFHQHVNDGVTLELPDTEIKNTLGDIVLIQPSCVTGTVDDSTVTNSDGTFTLSVPAETNNTLPDIVVTNKDSNGEPVISSYPSVKDYTVPVRLPDENGWYRPDDWLPIKHLVIDGEEKAVILNAVWGDDDVAKGRENYCAFVCNGNYTVDWGDGTITNHGTGTQAEHLYVYNDIPASTYCSRGYRQAIITITPQAGSHLTYLNLSRKHSLRIAANASTNYLDVHISGTEITQIQMYEYAHTRCYLLEHFYAYQTTNKCVNASAMFLYCIVLKSVNLSAFNMTGVTGITNMFNTTYITNLNTTSLNMPLLRSMDSAFAGILVSILDLSSLGTSNVTNMSYLFYGGGNLISLILASFDTSLVTNVDYMFYGCATLQEIDLAHTTLAACSTNTNIVASTGSLRLLRLPQIGRTFTVANNQLDTNACNLLLGDLRDLNGSINTVTTNAIGSGYAVGDEMNIVAGNNNAVIRVMTIGSGGRVATYILKVAGTGYTVANALTTTNITGTGTGFKVNITALVTTQTITLTGNAGAATCDPSIATVKNWNVII